MPTPWNRGQRCRLYSRNQYGFIKHNVAPSTALDMLDETLKRGQDFAALPSKKNYVGRYKGIHGMLYSTRSGARKSFRQAGRKPPARLKSRG